MHPQFSTKAKVLGGFLILALLYSVFHFLRLQTLPASPSPTPTPLIAQTKTYANVYFSLSFPKDWQEKSIPQTTGELLLISPNTLPQGVNDPHISIARLSKTSKSYDNNLTFYRNHGYQESPVTIGTIPGIKLQGVTKTKVVQGTIITSPLQDTYYFLEDKNNKYMINTTYDGNKKEETFEALFQSMLSTLVFY